MSSPPLAETIDTDIAIIGGGIAGLWTLNQLRNRGYSAVLFENNALGSYQTVGSQGMIHGGIKYALAGVWNKSSEAISSMPDIWRACLRGEGKVDLRGCEVLSEDFYLWSSAGLQSKVSSFFASKLLRGKVERLKEEQFPAPLQHPDFRGQVYRLVDMVVDVPSLIGTLASRHRHAIFNIDWDQATLRTEAGQAVLDCGPVTVRPKQLLLTAGAGNEALVKALGGKEPAMQRRPLQQVLVKHQYKEKFFAHCTGGGASPRLTISTHRTSDGEPVWYLGGDLATESADDDPALLISKAQSELSQLLPWIDLGDAQWSTMRLDRAEPRQSALLRPDSAFVGALDSVENTLVAWPTKLALSPNLADEIETQLQLRGILPSLTPDLSSLAALGHPNIAETYWDKLFEQPA